MAECTAACLIDAPDFTYGGCGLLDSIRSGKIKAFLALRCDETIPDITDDTAIAAQIAASTLFVSPPITGNLPFPAFGEEITENCKPAQATQRTYTFNWDSYRVDNTSLTDSDVMDDLQQSLSTWTIAPVTCDNIVLVPQDFATDGVFFDMTGNISGVFDNTNAQVWRGEMQFIYNRVIKNIQLSDAVVTALGL